MKTNHFLSRLTDLSRRFIKRASVVERPPHPYTTARVLLRLSCLVIGLSALIILAAWSIKMVELDQESLIILVSLVAIFGITLLLSEVFERLDIARILPPLIFFLFGLHASITTAATTTFILLYAIAILLSSAMHSQRSMWRMTGLCILAHTITRAYHYHSVPADFIPPSITISAELIGIAFVQDFIVGQFKHSIQKVERVSQQLQAEMIERESLAERARFYYPGDGNQPGGHHHLEP
jgi:signal transduction histidine kinase